MRYSGSKARIAKDILPIITKNLTSDKLYIEPFVGGCNTFGFVDHPNKIGIDVNGYVISMWEHFKNGGQPPKEVSKELYQLLCDIANGTDMRLCLRYGWLIGYVLNSCSYGSAWMNGYAKANEKRGENHVLEAYNNMMSHIKNFKWLNESKFITGSYETAEFVLHGKNAVIYCDPPYQNTKGYVNDFDNDMFWEWVRKMSVKGHEVYVSEYSAPSDFKCIWQKTLKDGMPKKQFGDKQKDKIEKLFIYNG